jgi:hypothetical protein
MPVSSFGYFLDRLIELGFIVIDTRTDVRNSEAKLESPVSITEPRYKIRQRQTKPFNSETGFVTDTLTKKKQFPSFDGDEPVKENLF